MDKEFTPEEIAESLRHHIDQESCIKCPLYEEQNCTEIMHDTAADMLVELAAEVARLREERRWIPVEERLPEEFVSVLVCIPSENPLPTVKEAYLANGAWAAKMAIFFMEEVTHWKPMPKGAEAE